MVRRKTERVIASQSVEDMFNCVKNAAKKKSNTTTTPKYALSQVVDHKVLSQKHHFQEISRSREPAPRLSADLEPTTFCPPFKKSKLHPALKAAAFDEIASMGDADWYSPGAVGYLAGYADMQALRDVNDSNQWHLLGQRCFCRLVQRHCAIRKKGGGGPWLLGLGAIDGSVAATWPLIDLGTGMFKLRAQDETRKLVTIVDVNEWEAINVRFISPLGQAVAKELNALGVAISNATEVNVKSGSDYGHLPIVVKSTGPVKGLWQIAAESAFWDLPLTLLREYAEKLDVALTSCTLVGVIESLYKHAYPAATIDEITRALDRRNLYVEHDLSCADDLCSIEWVTDAFDREFSETVKGEIQASKTLKQDWDDYVDEVFKYKARFC